MGRSLPASKICRDQGQQRGGDCGPSRSLRRKASDHAKTLEITKLFEVFDEKALRKYAYEYASERVSDFEAEARQMEANGEKPPDLGG